MCTAIGLCLFAGDIIVLVFLFGIWLNKRSDKSLAKHTDVDTINVCASSSTHRTAYTLYKYVVMYYVFVYKKKLLLLHALYRTVPDTTYTIYGYWIDGKRVIFIVCFNNNNKHCYYLTFTISLSDSNESRNNLYHSLHILPIVFIAVFTQALLNITCTL